MMMNCKDADDKHDEGERERANETMFTEAESSMRTMMTNCKDADDEHDQCERERASETSELCGEQLRKDAARKRQREHRERETLDQRAERLRKMGERWHQQVARETFEERAERRRKNAERKRAERLRKDAEKKADKEHADSAEPPSSVYLKDAKATRQVMWSVELELVVVTSDHYLIEEGRRRRDVLSNEEIVLIGIFVRVSCRKWCISV